MIIDEILIGTQKEILDYFKKELNYIDGTVDWTTKSKLDHYTCNISEDLTIKDQINKALKEKNTEIFQIFYFEHVYKPNFDGLINPNRKVNKKTKTSEIYVILKSKYIRIIPEQQDLNAIKNIKQTSRKRVK